MASKRIIVRLYSTAGTGAYYVSTRKKVQGTKKLSMRKYDRIARKHTIFNEGK